MRTLKELQTFWTRHQGQAMMLCTIVGKKGSGYRGLGAKKIICRDGVNCGYLSGGCLDGDIVRRALENWDKTPFIEAFSTMSAEDRLLGYQTGCQGIIEILFESLPGDVSRMAEFLPYGPRQKIKAIAISLTPETMGQRTLLEEFPEETPPETFIDRWIEPVNLFVIGSGPNAQSFADLVPVLGWNATFLDYRSGNRIAEQESVRSAIVPLHEIGQKIPEGEHNAVIVMTHNYEADLAIMAQLNGRKFGYIGCLGPRGRFEQMKQDMPAFHAVEMQAGWADNVHAPAGLKQGRLPEDIAFSILAEIQMSAAAA